MGNGMEFDIFFSISQTPDSSGYKPSEREMFSNFLDQAEKADELGFGVGWVAQAHLSTEVQKSNVDPVFPTIPAKLVCALTSSKSLLRSWLGQNVWR